MIDDNLNSIGNQLNELCKKYENFILIGDFNSAMCEDSNLLIHIISKILSAQQHVSRILTILVVLTLFLQIYQDLFKITR